MSRAVIIPYNNISHSARSLQSGFRSRNIETLKVVNSSQNYRQRRDDLVLNWGSTLLPAGINDLGRVLNQPTQVAIAVNKLSCFQVLADHDIPIPSYTTEREQAVQWIMEGQAIVQRNLLRGHSGNGIVIATEPQHLSAAPLYVLYKKKRNEYRVHVFPDGTYDIQEKRRAADASMDDTQSRVRSHANGWVFCRDDISVHSRIYDIASHAINALGLDFGAVDIIYNARQESFYVLEINTAVGLEGQTLTNYVDHLAPLFA